MSSVFSLGIIVLIPCGIARTLWIIYKLGKDVDQKYEKLVEAQNSNTKIGLYWQPIINIRWLATNLILVLLKNSPQTQIQLLLILSVVS